MWPGTPEAQQKILGRLAVERADAWVEAPLALKAGREQKTLSTLATALRTFAYSLSAKRVTKYALNCFFETGNLSLTVQARASKVEAFS